MSKSSLPGYCTLCTSTCGTRYEVENDRIVGVTNNPEHPTGAAMCLKGKAATELVDSTERLRTPMRRTRPKGSADPGWEAISWDEALAEIAGRLTSIKAESGAEAVAFSVTTPSGTPICDSSEWIERFIYKYGSPNVCYATEICNWHKDMAYAFTFGCGLPTPDFISADLIILWGHNPANTWLAQAHAIGQARKAGAKLIVIDPRDTALAKEADVWLRVRPGSDAVLALGLANALITAERFDQDFIHHWSNAALLVRDDNGELLRGRDIGRNPEHAPVYWSEANDRLELHVCEQAAAIADGARTRGRCTVLGTSGQWISCTTGLERYVQACQTYSPEYVVEQTWVDAAALIKAVEMIGASERVALSSWTGVEQHSNATQTSRAISCFYALTGSFDREGGNRRFTALPALAVNQQSLLPIEQRSKALGFEERPLGPAANGWITSRDLYEAVIAAKPYQVRGLMSFGGNLLLSQADTALAVQAFESLEFHVHCDLFMNPTAAYADIILPVNSPWEREALKVGFGLSALAQEWVQLRPQMVSSRFDSRSDADIVFALAERMGMQDEYFGKSREHAWNTMLRPLGLTVEKLREHPQGVRQRVQQTFEQYRKTGFETPTGLVELYSERLAQHGYPALPTVDVALLAQPDAEYPYVLGSAKSGYFCHSQHRQLTSLRRKSRFPCIEMSSQLAEGHNIADMDWVVVRTRNGQARFKAKINDQLHPRVMFGQHGWWQACTALGIEELPFEGATSSNFNSLIDTRTRDPLSGSIPLRSFVCSIEREGNQHQAPSRWQGYKGFHVSRIEAELDGAMRVHLTPDDGLRVPGFEVGQHIAIRLSLPDGSLINRAYSLVGLAAEPSCNEYVLCVRNARHGLVEPASTVSASEYINRHLRLNDSVEVQAPSGGFTIPVHASRPLVFHAGGIGITPFITALETAALQQSTARFLLLYGNRNSDGHVFKARLQELQAQLPGLQIVDVYSRPLESDVEGVDYQHRGYAAASMIPAGFLEGRPLHYMCGADAMMAEMAEVLKQLGTPRQDIFSEAFKSSVNISTRPSGRFQVTFKRSRKTVTWSNECGPLLDFADQLGLSLPSGCRVGQCESCSVRLVDGQVLHLQGHPDEEGACLTCQAIPLSDITLDA